ncbi:MAG: extracellular solute-binding protein [Clostridia bacterium]|nr:extracellular solute-binding protein [Clostridia bacterium]
MKRLLLLLLVLGMVIVAFVGCNPAAVVEDAVEDAVDAVDDAVDDAADAVEDAVDDAMEKEPVTIEAFIVGAGWVDQWPEMKASFEAEYPWITVIEVGTGPEEGFLASRMAASDIPDIVSVDNTQVSYDAVDGGLVADLSDLEVTGNIPQAYLDAFTRDGKIFGLTQGAAFTCLYVNMAALNEAGWDAPPANFEEFVQVCKDIEEKTDYEPLTVAGDKTTTAWMVYEGIIATEVGPLWGPGGYEEKFRAGEIVFSDYPDATAKFAEIAPYFVTGSATNTEDDVTAAMADGVAAMAIAGNWTANPMVEAIATFTGDVADAAVTLLPYNDPGEQVWISISPETAWGMSAVDDGAAINEARELFFTWLMQPENFKIVQNARGTVPVLTTLTDDQIILPDAIKGVLAPMNDAPFVLMGFNLWTETFRDAACTAIRDVMGGNKTADEAVTIMTDVLATSNMASE